MDTQTSALPASLAGAPPAFGPDAVPRWTARLVDDQIERGYRLHRFADDRRRALLMIALWRSPAP